MRINIYWGFLKNIIEIINLKYTETRDNTFHLNNNNKSTIATKDSNENNKNLETQDKKTGDDKVNYNQ